MYIRCNILYTFNDQVRTRKYFFYEEKFCIFIPSFVGAKQNLQTKFIAAFIHLLLEYFYVVAPEIYI